MQPEPDACKRASWSWNDEVSRVGVAEHASCTPRASWTRTSQMPPYGVMGMAPLLEPSDSTSEAVPPPKAHVRLASLDIVRGFAVALMVFVDELGEAYPYINHSPWNNVTLADFVMPWFLFMVGTSLSLSLRKFEGERRAAGTRFVLWRTLKLVAMGVLLQGGGFFYRYSYGYNLAELRFCGILQRIGYAYCVASLIELWVPECAERRAEQRDTTAAVWPAIYPSATPQPSPHLSAFVRPAWRWLVALAFVAVQLCLTMFTHVPSWHSEYGFDAASAVAGSSARLSKPFLVECGVRGSFLTPECSAQGYYDRMFFGQDRLGMWMSKRLPECSLCSPGEPEPTYRPDCRWNLANQTTPTNPWCFAYMYDPEGLLSTLPTVLSVWLGAHYGRVLQLARAEDGSPDHVPILLHWFLVSVALVAGGVATHLGGLPMNKQLWSPSYLMFMAGTCGAALTGTYAAVDASFPSRSAALVSSTVPPLTTGVTYVAGANAGAGAVASADSSLPITRRVVARGGALTRARRILRRILFPLQAMGMNAILFFFWHGTAEAVLNTVYFVRPRSGAQPTDAEKYSGTLLGWLRESGLAWVGGQQEQQAAYVLLKLFVYLAVAVLLHRRNYFWKI